MFVFRGVSAQKKHQKNPKKKTPSFQVHDSDALELDMHAMEHVRDPQWGAKPGGVTPQKNRVKPVGWLMVGWVVVEVDDR